MFKISYIGTLGKLATPPGGHFIDGLICFGYFRGRLSNDHFYEKFLNSTTDFREDLQSFCYLDKPPTLQPLFLMDQIFVEGHLVFAKLFSILTTSFRGEDFS